jgi:NADH:ubiquinone oxidoreductase subunit F (NADH-binding)
MGTTLAEVIEAVGGGALDGRRVVAVLPGVSNAVIGRDALDVKLSYEAMSAAGTGLGSGGFVVYDDHDDLVEVAAGASRFLFVESCGQCSPCKLDGGAISGGLDSLLDASLDPTRRAAALDTVRARLDTVADGARCALAGQHETVVRSILDLVPEQVAAHVAGPANDSSRALVGELVDLHDGITLVDEHILTRQPDWTDNETDSGETPAERLGDHRAEASV